MAGFQVNNASSKRVRWPWIVAAAFGAGALVAALGTDKESPVPPQTPATEKRPEPETQFVRQFFSVASSLGSIGNGQGATREDADKKARAVCEQSRKNRDLAGTHIEAAKFPDGTACVVRATISNDALAPCVAVFSNNIVYNYIPHVMTGSSIDITQRMRDFLRSAVGKRFITNDSHAYLHCVEDNGKVSSKDHFYALRRP